MLGPEWQRSIFDFYTLTGAEALAPALACLRGGRLVVHVAEMPIKCPVAPLEFAFLADDWFRRHGVRDEVEMVYVTPLDGAFQVALALAVAIYAVIAVTALVVLGSDGVAVSNAPLVSVVAASTWDWAVPVVRVGAAAAALGALLALIAGVGRTTLAMAREGDLPRWLSAVHPRFRVPHHAEVVLAIVVCVLVLTIDLRGAIGFSSFGVLIYYLVANLSAFTQDSEHRLFPGAFQVVGVAGCAALAVTLPLSSVLRGTGVLLVGVGCRLFRLRRGAIT